MKSMKPRALAILLLIALAFLPACNSTTTPPASATAAADLDIAGMDKSIAPGDDFYQYVNGTWLKNTPIPPDKAAYGIFAIMVDETRKRTVSLIQDAAKTGAASGSDAQKVGDFYSSFMDEAAIESKGVTPLKKQLDTIAAIKDRRALAEVIGSTLRADVDPLNNTNFETDNLFGVWVTQGLEDPDHNTPYLLQGGLGMPDRDYYISNTPKMVELRNHYKDHVGAMLKLAGFADATARAARVFGLETKIA